MGNLDFVMASSRMLLVLAGLASVSAFMVNSLATPAARRLSVASAPPQMALDVSGVDAATQLLALQIPIPAYTPAKAFVMIASNIFVICTMSIQGKSLISGTSHDEMVESFGIVWLLSGTSLGHIVGAGAILGLSASGVL